MYNISLILSERFVMIFNVDDVPLLRLFKGVSKIPATMEEILDGRANKEEIRASVLLAVENGHMMENDGQYWPHPTLLQVAIKVTEGSLTILREGYEKAVALTTKE